MTINELYRITDARTEDDRRIFDVEINPLHDVFTGHFPDNPVLPGICTLMIVRDCASSAIGSRVTYGAIRDSKFLAPIVPGVHKKLVVGLKVGEAAEDGARLDATVTAGENIVLKLRATLRLHEDGVGWKEKAARLGCAAVIPTYNNDATLAAVIGEVGKYIGDIIVVNDGSTDRTAEILAATEGIEVVSYTENRGKGHALKTGLRRAAERGFSYTLTIDSDGQHYAEDIPAFITQAEVLPGSLIIGARNLAEENMPAKNTFANRFSNFWFRIETGLKMEDTQSGFRLYPLEKLAKMKFMTSRYEFELESAVRLAWKGVGVVNIPVKVYYPPQEERVSHFKPVRDFTRISLLNTVLVLIALLAYYPFKFLQWLTWGNIKKFFRNNITHSKDTNLQMALSIALGIFWGIVPVWGYQMILAGVTSHFLGLNKVVSIVSSNISIPPMIPFILYGSYVAGGLVLGTPLTISFRDITLESFGTGLLQYVLGSLILAVAAAVVVGLVSLLLLHIFRKQPADV